MRKFIKEINNKISQRQKVDVIVAFLMLFICVFVGKYVLPSGVNAAFAKRTSFLLIVPVIVFLVILLILLFSKAKKDYRFLKKPETLVKKDFILLLLPMTPIFQYVLLNQDILNLYSSLVVILFFFTLAFLLSNLLPWILSVFASKNVLMLVGLSFIFLLYNMSSLSADHFWFKAGSLKIQLLVLFVTFVLLFAAYKVDKRIAYLAVTVFFFVNAAVTLLNKDKSNSKLDHSSINLKTKTTEHISNNKITRTPDIFLLIYESYSNAETLWQYGFDNNQQLQFLKRNGFTIYDGVYSVASYTLPSMSRVLETQIKIQGDRHSRYILSGNATSIETLKQVGYKTFGVFPSGYWTQGHKPTYDMSFPAFQSPVVSGGGLLIKAILMGEFDQDVTFAHVDYSSFIKQKRDIMSSQYDDPIFLYTHNRYPGHAKNLGKCLPNETQLHIEGIEKANSEMQEDIRTLALSHNNSIIIVAGDHGPHLTKDCGNLKNYSISEIDRLDIQDRYGAFLAIKWPEGEYTNRYDIRVLQDIFPALFSYLFDNDSIFSQTRIERITVDKNTAGGVLVNDGYIVGGKDNGKPLFINQGVCLK